MAKTRAKNPDTKRITKTRPEMVTAVDADPKQGGTLETFAEDLGRLLGTTERKAAEWLNQRQTVAQQLTAIRDKASDLLKQLGHLDVPFARTGRPAGGVKRGPGRPKGSAKRKKRVMSAEARERIAAAQRARWAKHRRAAKQGA